MLPFTSKRPMKPTMLMAGNITRWENNRMLPQVFTEITNSLSEPHFLLTKDGTIISANRAARKKFSLPDTIAETLNLATLMNQGAQKLKPLLHMWLRSKSPLPASIVFKARQDAPDHYLCKGNTLRSASNGESALIMLQCTNKKQSTAVFVALNQKIEQLTREIVERRNAEKEVRLLNQELERRV
ncbi:MAG: hypothetical protein QNL05_06590, partial [Gammaproteobacteria bacterium]|nr:hypothetical protein [Gammaproteobacteria bacterium]